LGNLLSRPKDGALLFAGHSGTRLDFTGLVHPVGTRSTSFSRRPAASASSIGKSRPSTFSISWPVLLYRFILNASVFPTAERLMDASHKQICTGGSCGRPRSVATHATSPNTTNVQQTAERGIDYLLSRADTIPPAWKFSMFGTLAKLSSSSAHLEAIGSIANQGQKEPAVALRTPLKTNDLRWPRHLQKNRRINTTPGERRTLARARHSVAGTSRRP
jgi:hypothetical protein